MKTSIDYYYDFECLNGLFEREYKTTKDISKNINLHYSNITIPKKRGGLRLISVPDEPLRRLQKLIFPLFERALLIKDKHTEIFMDKDKKPVLYNPGSCSYGFEKKKNIKMNAEQHKDSQYFLKLDIHHFFSSIPFNIVCRMVHECILINEKSFKNLYQTNKTYIKENSLSIRDIYRLQMFRNPNYMSYATRRTAIEQIIANLLCQDGSLATGACTSPLVANYYMRDFDKQMYAYLYRKIQRNGQNFIYTRYADDITISSDKPIPLSVLKMTTKKLQAFGLTINEEKTHFQSNKAKNVITGVNVTQNGRLTVGRKKKEEVKKLLYKKARAELSYQEEHVLQGNINFINSIEPEWMHRMKEKYIRFGKLLF